MEKLKTKVVMLPTEKAIELDNDSKVNRFQKYLTLGKLSNELRYDIPFWIDNSIEIQHLYFVSEREIEVGDWFLSDGRLSKSFPPMYNVEKCIDIDNEWIYGNINGKDLGNNPNFSLKIEATTDPSLNLPLIPQSFIKEYVEEQGEIDEVMIEIEYKAGGRVESDPMIHNIKLKLRKDNTVIVSKVEEKILYRK